MLFVYKIPSVLLAREKVITESQIGIASVPGGGAHDITDVLCHDITHTPCDGLHVNQKKNNNASRLQTEFYVNEIIRNT